jgi:hypothetical protein
MENKGDKKDTCQYALVLGKIFLYLFMHQKDNPQKPPVKVKRTKEEMQTTLDNRKKATTNFPISDFKKNNIVEEAGLKREQESTYLKAQKMMRGIVEPSIVLIVVRVMPIVVQAIRQITVIPQFTSP